jgi:hypothetical protein
LSNYWKRIAVLLLILMLSISLTGCFSVSAEELYSLPQAAEGNIQLQQTIDQALAEGAEYSSPTSGVNRQAVQLKDLDGDGVEEALAFFTVSGDKPLKIYIYRRNDKTYERVAVIDGDGTAIRSVEYVDMNGDGWRELIVGWQMSSTIQMLSVYSLRDFQPVPLFSTDYTEYAACDLTADRCTDVLVLRLESSGLSGEAECYSMMADGEVVSSTAKISDGVESIAQVITGKLSDGTEAVFVESTDAANNNVTDIFCCIRDGSLKNITLSSQTNASIGTVRSYSISSTDINEDGIIEVPCPWELPAQTETRYWAVDWYSYNVNGRRTRVLTTYHNPTDGWYLIIPDSWRQKVTVRREDRVAGERTLVFSQVLSDDGSTVDFLKIYTLSGENREERSKVGARFILTCEGDKIYAAEILQVTNDYSITVDTEIVQENFNVIYSDWLSELS